MRETGWALATAAILTLAPAEGGEAMEFGAWFPEFRDDFTSFQRNYRSFDSVSLFYYGVTTTGAVVGASHPEHPGMIAWARDRGVKVFATIGGTPPTLPGGYTGANGERCVADLVALCGKYGYDGVDVDFEGMNNTGRAAYTIFAEKLASALRKMTPPRLLSVTVQDFPSAEDEASMAFDYGVLAGIADEVRVMCYDYSWAKPGSLMPREWFAEVLAFARSRIPAEKFVAALPWYGRDWIPAKDTHKDFVYGQTGALTGTAGYRELLARYRVKPVWDEPGGEYWFKYNRAGEEHVVWSPEAKKFDWMTAEVMKAGAKGIYVWHAAYPNPDSLKVLRKRLKKPATPASGPAIPFPGGSRPLAFTYSASGGSLSLDTKGVDAVPAHQLAFKLRMQAGTQFVVELEEGTRSGDGEVYLSDPTPGAGEWTEYVFALQALSKSVDSGNKSGNGRLDQNEIRKFTIRVLPDQGADEVGQAQRNVAHGDGFVEIKDVKFTLVWRKRK
jgi:spore germination protein YaaH